MMREEWEMPTISVLILDDDDIICTSDFGDEDIGEWDGM